MFHVRVSYFSSACDIHCFKLKKHKEAISIHNAYYNRFSKTNNAIKNNTTYTTKDWTNKHIIEHVEIGIEMNMPDDCFVSQ